MLAGRKPVKRAAGRRIASKKRPSNQSLVIDQTIQSLINKHQAFPMRHQIQEIKIEIARQHLAESNSDQIWTIPSLESGYYSRVANCLFLKASRVEKNEVESPEVESPEVESPEALETTNTTEITTKELETETASTQGPQSQSSKAVEPTGCQCCFHPRTGNRHERRLMTDLQKKHLSKNRHPVISVEIYTDDHERWMISPGEMIQPQPNQFIIFGDLVISPINNIPLRTESKTNESDDSENSNESDDSANSNESDDSANSNDSDTPVLVEIKDNQIDDIEDDLPAFEENIELVMAQISCDRSQAIKALKDNKNDLVEAIMSLM